MPSSRLTIALVVSVCAGGLCEAAASAQSAEPSLLDPSRIDLSGRDPTQLEQPTSDDVAEDSAEDLPDDQVDPDRDQDTRPAAEPAGITQTQPDELDMSLDDLVPESATANAADWAAEGLSAAGTSPLAEQSAIVATNDATDPGEEAFEEDEAVISVARADTGAAPFDVDAELEQLAIPTPDLLAPQDDIPSFADLAAPDLLELPELKSIEISDELVLSFPADNTLFPEEDNFVARFRALSSIEKLDSDEDTIPQLAARARSDEKLLVQVLRTYGYYNGEIVRQLSGGRRGIAEQDRTQTDRAADTDPKVLFDIVPGERYHFGGIDLGNLSAVPAPDYEGLRDAFGIQTGDPLYSDRIVDEDLKLRLALAESGFPFAEVDELALLIDHDREEGDLTLLVEPGGKYNFGDVISSDPAFLSSDHLARIGRFDPGDLYQASLQSDLRSAILATGLVSSVVITPKEVAPPTDGEPGEIALDVELERAPLRTVSAAVGYGTEDGIKVTGGWEHRNLFPSEGALILRGTVGTREQLGSVTFRRNNYRDRDQVLTVGASASDIETEAVDARTLALRSTFERVSNLLFQKPFSWLAGAEVLYSDERNRVRVGEQGPRETFRIASLFGSATVDASDNLLDPTTGFRLTGFLSPEFSRSQGANSYYLRTQGDASYYQEIGSTVVAARTRLASIVGAEASEIAPSRRLYSGGGGSVRGYAFQSIGPRDEFDEPIGGRSLAEFAIEARVQTGFLDGALEVVPFFDLGTVGRNELPDFRTVQFGAGLGFRYKTSFGPIRVDIGAPLNPRSGDAPVVVNVSLGQAF